MISYFLYVGDDLMLLHNLRRIHNGTFSFIIVVLRACMRDASLVEVKQYHAPTLLCHVQRLSCFFFPFLLFEDTMP